MKEPLKQQIWDQSKEWMNAIGDVITQMAKQLGVGAEHVYRVYTQQMFVEGIVYSVVSLAIIVTLITLMVKIYKWTDNWDDEEGILFCRIFGTVIGIVGVMLLIFIVFVPYTLQALNPEYYTLQYLMETVKGLVRK